MNKSKLGHAALADLEYEDGILVWGGRKVTEIAEGAGQTPFYAYDRARISGRVNDLRRAMPPALRIHYAVKANPMPGLVDYMATLTDGLDIASAGELRLALATRMEPANVSFAGPGKKDTELEAAIDAGAVVNLESANEMRRIAALGAKSGVRPRVAVRINPRFELRSSGMKMGGRPSPFGVDEELVPELLEELKTLDLEFVGFQVYAGSQSLDAEAIASSIASTTELVIGLAQAARLPVSTVNLGGGFGIPYFPGERALPLAPVAEAVERSMAQLQAAFGQPEVVLELGRYLIGEAGIYVCRVVDVKQSRGMRYAVTDGGMHHHLAASGNLGQVIRKNYPVASVRRSDDLEEVTIVGPLCTPLDLLADRVRMAPLKPGSLVAVLQSGAYGRTASPGRFLSHPDCLELLI